MKLRISYLTSSCISNVNKQGEINILLKCMADALSNFFAIFQNADASKWCLSRTAGLFEKNRFPFF